MESIIKSLCEYLNVQYEDVMRKTNNHNISMQRNYIYYILHYDFKFSINQIGKCFKRSGREINYRISEMKYRIEYFKDYRAKYVDLYDYALNHSGFKESRQKRGKINQISPPNQIIMRIIVQL